MKLEESFDVDAPVEEVWKALIDVQRVAPCLPGAEITDATEDGTYQGNFKVRLGPTTAAYSGTLKLESIDEAARVATMDASGRDKRGQGGAKARMVSTVTEADGGGARVHVDTDFTITGRLARFGRGGMIQDISKRLLGDFAACLQEELRGSGGAEVASQPAEGRSVTAGSVTPVHDAATRGPEASAHEPASATSTAGHADPTPSGPPPPSSAPAQAHAGQPARRSAEPVRGFSLLVSILRERIRTWLKRRRGKR